MMKIFISSMKERFDIYYIFYWIDIHSQKGKQVYISVYLIRPYPDIKVSKYKL